VTVEQDMQRRSCAPPMAEDHRLAARRLDARLKADVAQVLRAPFLLPRGRLRDRRGRWRRFRCSRAGTAGRARPAARRRGDRARAKVRRAMYAAHSRPHLRLCFRHTRSSSQHGEGHNRRTGKIRLSDAGRLFGELYVDGLRAFATAVRLGFEGHALTFIDSGEA